MRAERRASCTSIAVTMCASTSAVKKRTCADLHSAMALSRPVSSCAALASAPNNELREAAASTRPLCRRWACARNPTLLLSSATCCFSSAMLCLPPLRRVRSNAVIVWICRALLDAASSDAFKKKMARCESAASSDAFSSAEITRVRAIAATAFRFFPKTPSVTLISVSRSDMSACATVAEPPACAGPASTLPRRRESRRDSLRGPAGEVRFSELGSCSSGGSRSGSLLSSTSASRTRRVTQRFSSAISMASSSALSEPTRSAVRRRATRRR
mmetsp:Transcript_34085/g.80324  ORF Transcript_34085/g.80324 Transcript_34085/m.80324 type:complete len:272 (-) Transcript_34085:518-1333(-)